MIKLFSECEKAKQTLTPEGVAVAKINVEYLMQEIDFRSELKLDDMEDMVAPLLQRLLIPISKCLKDINLTAEQLTAVEIVGGGSRPRCVKRAISAHLGLDQSLQNYGLSTTLNADESVARGCALSSAILSPQFRVKEFAVADTVNYPIKLTWDEKDVDASQLDLDGLDGEGDQEESTVGKNSIVIMQEGDETPKTRRVTFRRRESFDIVASYADESVLPYGASKEVATFRVSAPPNAKDVDEAPKIRVNFRHNINGVFEMLSAQYLEAVEPKPEPPKSADESKGKAAEDSTPAADGNEEKAAGKNEEAPAPEKEPEKPKKKTYKRIELNIISDYSGGLKADQIQSCKTREQTYSEADTILEQTSAVRNELETYIYSIRDRIDGALRDFVTDEERESFKAAVEKEEAWLYDEGFDETMEKYSERLRSLRETGDRYEVRYVEQQERPRAHRSLTSAIDEFLAVVNSSDEKYEHLTDEDREKVRKACEETSQWLDQQSAGQEKLPQTSDPVLTSGMINEEVKKVQRICLPVVNKKKPPPPKPKEQKKPEEGQKEESKNNEEDNDEKMPDADDEKNATEENTEGRGEQGKADADKMDTSSLD